MQWLLLVISHVDTRYSTVKQLHKHVGMPIKQVKVLAGL